MSVEEEEVYGEFKVYEILPNNERTEKIMRKRKEEEEKKNEWEAEWKRRKDKEEREKKRKEKQDQHRQQALADERKEKEKKKQEAAAELKQLKGKMSLMLKHLKYNTSPAAYSMAGIQINPG